MSQFNTAERLEFVRQQCRTIPGAIYRDKYTMICCPFHGDTNPSGRIAHAPDTRYPGYFKCYGCGKTATWDELAPLIGCEPFTQKPVVRFSQAIDLSDMNESGTREELVFSELPKDKLWRHIPTNLLRDIGAKVCRVKYASGYGEKFVYLPVIIDGETAGYTKARLHKIAGKSSYINLGGAWVKTHGLFPFDYAVSKMTATKTIVLVEGQRDALRLLNMGIPAMCIMGTQSWSEEKSRLLEMHGVERCIILMDGDDAGISGTKKVFRILKNIIPCVIIKLWQIKGSPYLQFADLAEPSKAAKEKGVELYDPGNCPEWILRKIKERYIES